MVSKNGRPGAVNGHDFQACLSGHSEAFTAIAAWDEMKTEDSDGRKTDHFSR
jgi:hypothetical protein